MKKLINILTLLVAFCISTNAQTVEDLFKTYRNLIQNMPSEIEKNGVTVTSTPEYKLIKKREIQKAIKHQEDYTAEQIAFLEKVDKIESLYMPLTDEQRNELNEKLNNLSGFTQMTELIKNSESESSDNLITNMMNKINSLVERYQACLYGKGDSEKLSNLIVVMDWIGITTVIHFEGEFSPEQITDVESLFENQ